MPRFKWDYFLVEPDVLVLSHLPLRAEWQLLRKPMQRREFERLPAVPMTLLARGFAPAEIRAAGRRGTSRDLPLVADEPGLTNRFFFTRRR